MRVEPIRWNRWIQGNSDISNIRLNEFVSEVRFERIIKISILSLNDQRVTLRHQNANISFNPPNFPVL